MAAITEARGTSAGDLDNDEEEELMMQLQARQAAMACMSDEEVALMLEGLPSLQSIRLLQALGEDQRTRIVSFMSVSANSHCGHVGETGAEDTSHTQPVDIKDASSVQAANIESDKQVDELGSQLDANPLVVADNKQESACVADQGAEDDNEIRKGTQWTGAVNAADEEESSSSEEDEHEALEKLEARRATICCLSAEEASAMLTGLPPAQVVQLVLLMGETKRSAALALLPDDVRAAVAIEMAPEVSGALGLARALPEGTLRHDLPSQLEMIPDRECAAVTPSPADVADSPLKTGAAVEPEETAAAEVTAEIAHAGEPAEIGVADTPAEAGALEPTASSLKPPTEDADISSESVVVPSQAMDAVIVADTLEQPPANVGGLVEQDEAVEEKREDDGSDIVSACLIGGRDHHFPSAEVKPAHSGRHMDWTESRMLHELSDGTNRQRRNQDAGLLWEARYAQRLAPADAANLLESMSPQDAARLAASLGRAQSLAALGAMDAAKREEVLAAMPFDAAAATGFLDQVPPGNGRSRDFDELSDDSEEMEASSSAGTSSSRMSALLKERAAKTVEWSGQAMPSKVTELGGKAAVAAGTAATIARHGFAQAAVSSRSSLEAAGSAAETLAQKTEKVIPPKVTQLGGKAFDAAGSAAGFACHSLAQASESSKVKEMRGKAIGAKESAAELARQGIGQVSTKVNAHEAKDKLNIAAASAADVAKGGLASVSRGVAGFMRKKA